MSKSKRSIKTTVQPPVRKDLLKYWQRRYTLFSKFDEGIVLNDQQWYSVTPEASAQETARFIRNIFPHDDTIIDACGGAGGNTIQFALSEEYERVIYCELDDETTGCAKNNANVYDCADSIVFYNCDLFKLHQHREVEEMNPAATTFFLSPPWGGTEYTSTALWGFNSLNTDLPDEQLDLGKVLAYVNSLGIHHFCLFLPKTINLNEVAETWVKDSSSTVYVHYLYNFGACLGTLVAFDTNTYVALK